ncbi:hypothetical protein NP233_g5398 [Leucocoprinus birnbaumii]|uniref:Uncharacterized protein n=1 Tax=Leucocoprinus birnbaumii TaxID=56174 RepID=A0AAD5VWL5_9AGAR|nr:hypothetical protein NP233_g5398 [Leucocoprinus birnbaumii]
MTPSPSPPRSVNLSSSLEEENTTLKRKINDLEKRLEELTSKRKGAPNPIRVLGRAVCRLVSCYEAPSILTKEADRRALAELEGTQVTPTTDEERELVRVQDRRFMAYRKLIEVAPRVAELLKTPDAEDKLTNYLEQLELGISSARTDDNSRVKWEVALWLNDAFEPDKPLRMKDRNNRGLQHDVCGRLLTPIEVDWDDLNMREAIRNGTSEFNINESYFLRCFYPDEGIDPNNVEHNFLRSRWLLLTFHAIFISPSVDEDQYIYPGEDEPPCKKQKHSKDGTSKSNVACRIGMNGRVTSRVIAYTAVMLVFNLTEASRWSEVYNGFSFHSLYNFIIDFFEDTPDPASRNSTQSLLQWWNHEVFTTQYAYPSDGHASYRKLASQRASRARN